MRTDRSCDAPAMADIALQHAVQAVLDELVVGGDEVGLQAAVIKDGDSSPTHRAASPIRSMASPVRRHVVLRWFDRQGRSELLVHALVAAGRLDDDLRLAEVWPSSLHTAGERDRATCPHAPGRRARTAA